MYEGQADVHPLSAAAQAARACNDSEGAAATDPRLSGVDEGLDLETKAALFDAMVESQREVDPPLWAAEAVFAPPEEEEDCCATVNKG